MKYLEIFLTLTMWLLIGIVIWALWPWLVKFWVFAAQVHAMGLR